MIEETDPREGIAMEEAFVNTLTEKQQAIYKTYTERAQTALGRDTAYVTRPEEAEIMDLRRRFFEKQNEGEDIEQSPDRAE